MTYWVLLCVALAFVIDCIVAKIAARKTEKWIDEQARKFAQQARQDGWHPPTFQQYQKERLEAIAKFKSGGDA